MTETHVHRVVEKIEIEASPERVFRALADPDEIVAWWGSDDDYRVVEAHLDLRVDGAYRLDAVDGEGRRFAVEGTYLVVDPPRRLSYTWNPSWADDDSVVDLTLEPRGAVTCVRVEHTRITASSEVVEGYREGWRRIFGWLRTHAEE